MKQGYVKIKVKPEGKMVLIQTETLTKQIANFHLPDDMRLGAALIRSTVLAVGSECTRMKVGDTIYFANGANCAEVEIFARMNFGDIDHQNYLLHEDNIPAKYEIVSEDNEEPDVVIGLSGEGFRLAQERAQAMAEDRSGQAQASPRIYIPK